MKKGKSEGSQAFNVPATDEGKAFIKLLRKFSNRPDCQISVRGRGKRAVNGKSAFHYSASIPLCFSEWFAVYIRSAKKDKYNSDMFNKNWAKIQEQMKRIKELEEQVQVKVKGNDRIDSLQATNTAMTENIKKLQNRNIELENQVKGLKITLVENQERYNELLRQKSVPYYDPNPNNNPFPTNAPASALLGMVTISVKGANIRIVQEQE